MIRAFLCTSGINLAFTGVSYLNIPRKNQALFIGFYSTMGNLGALLSVNVARLFITGMEGTSCSLPGIPFGEKHLWMLIVSTVMAAAGLAVRWVCRTNLRENAEI